MLSDEPFKECFRYNCKNKNVILRDLKLFVYTLQKTLQQGFSNNTRYSWVAEKSKKRSLKCLNGSFLSSLFVGVKAFLVLLRGPLIKTSKSLVLQHAKNLRVERTTLIIIINTAANSVLYGYTFCV